MLKSIKDDFFPRQSQKFRAKGEREIMGRLQVKSMNNWTHHCATEELCSAALCFLQCRYHILYRHLLSDHDYDYDYDYHYSYH